MENELKPIPKWALLHSLHFQSHFLPNTTKECSDIKWEKCLSLKLASEKEFRKIARMQQVPDISITQPAAAFVLPPTNLVQNAKFVLPN